jgi:hypothetical protein
MKITKSQTTLLCLLLFSLGQSKLLSNDPEITNYKSGISLLYGKPGTPAIKGSDYQEEYLYHDKLITDRKVIYIKSTTDIHLIHNELNTRAKGNSNILIGKYGEDNLPNSGDEGIIRYKIDGDLNFNMRWSTYPTDRILCAEYVSPFNFSELNYKFDNSPVLGKTGSNLQKPTPDNRSNFYHFGTLDSFGDEWHTITVGDDDSLFVNQTEHQASDGKIFYFVVDPKTPILSLSTQGNAQFYTTPQKSYFLPTIHNPTTYISEREGEVNLKLNDIFGNNIYFRIVKDPNDSNTPYISANSSSHSLSHENFSDNIQYLQYYYEGNASHTKTRKVVRNPKHPSLTEKHGLLLFGNTDNITATRNKLEVPYFKKPYTALVKYDFWNHKKAVETKYRSGERNVWKKQLEHAFVALMESNDFTGGYSKSFAETAKHMLLEHPRTLDPVGFELPHTFSGIPAKELHYRGYYDVNQIIGSAFAYDILIANYRSDQHSTGITPIEDLLIRDHLASFSYECLLWQGGYTGMFPGMWGTSRLIGAILNTITMPNYSTRYYGTSGFKNKNTETAHSPYPDTPLTWSEVFILEEHLQKDDYPNLKYTNTIENMFTEEGYFRDRIPYYSPSLMGSGFQVLYNICKMHIPEKAYPRLYKSFELSINGKLQGTKFSNDNDKGDKTFSQLLLMNERFPDLYVKGTSLLEDTNGNPTKDLAPSVLPLVWYKPSSMHIENPSDIKTAAANK